MKVLLVIAASVSLTCRVFAQEIPFPRDLAFNSGFYMQDAADEALAKGAIEVVQRGTTILVRHIWIESFENDRRTSTLMSVVFASCESVFTPSIDGPSVLTSFTAKYVGMDYTGKPVGVPRSLSYQLIGGEWVRNSATVASVDQYERDLPVWERRLLHIISGYLYKFPGQNPILYDEDVQAGKLSALFGIVFGVALPEIKIEEAIVLDIVGEVVKDKIKDAAIDFIREQLKGQKARWGRMSMPAAPALTNREESESFVEAGLVQWPGFPVRFDGVWESQDDDSRFRLEISGASMKWIERRRDGTDAELTRAVSIKRTPDGKFVAARPFDAEVVKFQFPQRFQDVLDAEPDPASLALRFANGKLIGSYTGVRIRNGQVETADPLDFSFANTEAWRGQ